MLGQEHVSLPGPRKSSGINEELAKALYEQQITGQHALFTTTKKSLSVQFNHRADYLYLGQLKSQAKVPLEILQHHAERVEPQKVKEYD